MLLKTSFVKIGDFLFKYRNKLYPFILFVILFVFTPVSHELNIWLGGIIMLLGLLVRAGVIGHADIKHGGLSKEVYADQLLIQGMFAVCRNPLYVGNILIATGMFVAHGNIYLIIGGILFCICFYQSIIAAEEHFLRQTFVEAYDEYCSQVPRWLFKWNKLKQVNIGKTFSFKRVLIKDYAAIANAFVILMLLKLLKKWHFAQQEFAQAAILYGFLILAALIFVSIIAQAKKRKWLK